MEREEITRQMLAAREPVSKDEALRRLRARAAEWSTTDCEEICAHEVGDTIAELLIVLDLAEGA